MSIRLSYVRKLSSDTLSEILSDIEKLSELDMSLDTLEGSFSRHFPGVLTASVGIPDADVKSQHEALGKARQGLKAAKEMKAQVANILSAYPEDKTALRALSDTEKLIISFEKHEKAAAKILRTIASKQMPKALAAYAKKVETVLKSKFVDPDQLDVIPWINPEPYCSVKDQWGKVRSVAGFRFSVVFQVIIPSLFNYDGGKFRMSAVEESVGDSGVTITSSNSSSLNRNGGPELFIAEFLGNLKGWSGIKGEAETNVTRLKDANQIAAVLKSVASRVGGSNVEVTVDKAGTSVSVGFRTYLRGEDYGEYDESWSEEGRRNYKIPAEKALAPYKDKISRFSLTYSEKGYWNFDVDLK